jgi:hypothetical protein
MRDSLPDRTAQLWRPRPKGDVRRDVRQTVSTLAGTAMGATLGVVATLRR